MGAAEGLVGVVDGIDVLGGELGAGDGNDDGDILGEKLGTKEGIAVGT